MIENFGHRVRPLHSEHTVQKKSDRDSELRKASSLIIGSMNWASTVEGYTFWRYVCDRLDDIDGQVDDEKFLKEHPWEEIYELFYEIKAWKKF